MSTIRGTRTALQEVVRQLEADMRSYVKSDAMAAAAACSMAAERLKRILCGMPWDDTEQTGTTWED